MCKQSFKQWLNHLFVLLLVACNEPDLGVFDDATGGEEGSATRYLYDDWLSAAGVKLERTIKLNCPEAVKAVVGAGLGFYFISLHALREELRSKLVRLTIKGLTLRRPLCMIRHREKHDSPVLAEFSKLVAQSI